MNIVLGVGGGISAYKVASLLRLLKEDGHDVHVVILQQGGQLMEPSHAVFGEDGKLADGVVGGGRDLRRHGGQGWQRANARSTAGCPVILRGEAR